MIVCRTGQLQLLLLQCALNTEQSITVLAESEKYLTLELLTAKLLTLDHRTKFVIYQQEDVHIYFSTNKNSFCFVRQFWAHVLSTALC